ncbi:MAG: lipocalin-like domain-containing protein [Hyphomicrobiaceae bacterium]
MILQNAEVVGNWKLIAFETVLDDEPAPQHLFGNSPSGFMILTVEGRMIAIITADGRTSGTSDAERAALHKSMLAYSGKYRVEGSEFITIVDTSWNELWNGTEQRRKFDLQGGKLKIETVPAPMSNFPGKSGYSRLVWERESSV